MRSISTPLSLLSTLFFVTLLVTTQGCGGGDKKQSGSGSSGAKPSKQAGKGTDQEGSETAGKKKKFQPVQLDGKTDQAADGSKPGKGATIPNEKKVASVVVALQPFQIMLGDWRWTTFKKFGDFPKNGEDLKWIWDFKTDKSQPSVTFHSDKNPYFHTGSLTYIPEDDKFRFTATTPEDEQRVFEGTWAEGGEPKETFEGKKSERSYKLVLTQVSPKEGEQWRVVLNQQDNNRYLVELTKKSAQGTQFGKLDTVASQRLGTSFAAMDSDNPGPKCIISGGLGTMQVTYKGKSYPVCCTGCVAAFNDDPERWLAKLAKTESEMKKKDE